MDTAAAAVWVDPDTPAICLLILGLDRYLPRGPGAEEAGSPINWLPATWAAEIRDDCGIGLHPANADKLAAALTLLHSPDEFYSTVPGFHTLAEGLAAEHFDPSTSHPLSAAEIAWAVFQAAMVNPSGVFSPAVCSYVHRVCRDEGYPGVPHALKALGIAPDPAVPTGADLSGDPDLALLTAQSADDLSEDFESWLKDRIGDLADRIEKLPLRHSDPRPVATELRGHAGG